MFQEKNRPDRDTTLHYKLHHLFVFLCISIVSLQAASVRADELDEQFAAAIEALDAGQLRTAREALSGIVSTNPSLHRARLELARAYYLSYDYAAARRQVQQVLDDPNTPPSVRTTLLAFMAQINEDEKRFAERHHWTPSIYLGLMYDTNVNVGPNEDVIDIGGIPFLLSADSEKRSDPAFVVTPALTHTYNPGKRFELGEHSGFFLWQTQGNAYYRRYFDEGDFDLGVFTLRTGPAWVVPQHWRASIGLQGDYLTLGDSRLALFGSVNPTITWQIGDNTEFSLDGVVTRRHYNRKEDEGRDGWYQAGAASLGRYFNDRKLSVQGGIGYARLDTDEDRFGYDGPFGFVGGAVQAWKNGSVYGRFGYYKNDYDGPEPVFDEARNEDEYRTTVGFQHDIKSGPLTQWALVGNWIHTKNDSNVEIFEYDRDQVNMGLSRSF